MDPLTCENGTTVASRHIDRLESGTDANSVLPEKKPFHVVFVEKQRVMVTCFGGCLFVLWFMNLYGFETWIAALDPAVYLSTDGRLVWLGVQVADLGLLVLELSLIFGVDAEFDFDETVDSRRPHRNVLFAGSLGRVCVDGAWCVASFSASACGNHGLGRLGDGPDHACDSAHNFLVLSHLYKS